MVLRIWRRAWLVVAVVALAWGLAVSAQGGGAPPVVDPAQAPQGAPQGAPGVGAVPGGGRGQVPGGQGGGRGQVVVPEADFSPRPPIRGVSVEEQKQRFVLPPGYKIEAVLADPIVEEPMAIAFDGNGRMFVLEIRGYMQDADATGELDPVGRISVHDDVNNDGVYDKHAIFVDQLVFPRFVMPMGPNAILAMESNTDNIYKFTDTNGDDVADKKELFDTNFGKSGNVEHQQSSLFWGMDNWMYSTWNPFRIRWTPTGRVLREPTAPFQSQWGVTQDNHGKIYFQNGASGMPAHFQYPVHYGTYDVPDRFAPGLEVPWGLGGPGDHQGGMGSLRLPNQSLNRVTGAAGNEIFRGHRMPADLQGDLIYGEPVARIVRRLRDVGREASPQLENVYQWQYGEFIRSTDPLFRPVEMATAPDGTLYIVDTYRGIIQEGNWTRPGSYLRSRIDQYDLDKNVRMGRIWRLSYEGIDRDTTQPRMHDETPAQLVNRLAHPNGWWRDTAQQLLVLKQDKSVVPALQQMARTATYQFARFHALWTLEGLGALDRALVDEMLRDPAPATRVQAIRASETLYKAGDRTLGEAYKAAAKDSDADVAVQAMLTLKLFSVPGTVEVVRATMASNSAKGVQLVGAQILNPPVITNVVTTQRAASPEAARLITSGSDIYTSLCASCHGQDGRGLAKEGDTTGAEMAPPLAGSARVLGHRDYVIRTLLHGMTGPIEGKTFTEVMIPMGGNDDQWIASVASFIRNSFGNQADFARPEDVARVRAATSTRTTMWTVTEAEAGLPQLIPTDEAKWKATASHNTEYANLAFGYVAWSSVATQQPGMWFQLELPEAVSLTEIQFDSTQSGRSNNPAASFRGNGAAAAAAGGGGRGGRGAGGAPPPPGSGAPKNYQVQVSMDGTRWTTVAEKAGTLNNAVGFRPVQAKFVRITQTGTDANYPWSVQRLRLFRAATTR
jgi:mono/diheme cytochrome c family protein